jgi:hypothetical protein
MPKKSRKPKNRGKAAALPSNPQALGGFDALSKMMKKMLAEMSQNYITLNTEECHHGNVHLRNVTECDVANLFMTAYEDALNMVGTALCNEEHITKDMAPGIASSILGHNKVMDAMKGNMAYPMWSEPQHTQKIRMYLISLGTNLLLKKTERATNLALITANSISVLEKRGVQNDTTSEEFPFIENAKRFFEKRINCSCLKDIDEGEPIDHIKAMSDGAQKIKSYISSTECSNCGKAVDDTDGGKLKTCNTCQTAKYCNADCQKAHWKKHKMDCETIAMEQHDAMLFKEPPKRPDCEICFLPLPLNRCRVMYQPCCGKTLCYGCLHYSNINAKNAYQPCPFCREEGTTNYPDAIRLMEDRMKLNDAGAFYTLGSKCKDGMHGIKTDYKKAFELMSRAAELGSTDALYHVGFMLYMGQGVKKNVKKAIETFEIGAMRGCENARFNLAGFEPNKQKANKHLMIAARQGVDDAMKLVKDEFKAKRISKDEFEYTKSKYEEMVESLKSEQRDNAASLYKALGGVLDM